MALIICPECHKQVSSFATACPTCGYPISFAENNQEQDTLVFGHYSNSFLDNSWVSEKHPIEWLVLAHNENKALVLSKYGLFSATYLFNKDQGSWKTSNIRSLLNRDFFRRCFNDEEKTRIISTCIFAKNYESEDKIFLLSWKELIQYFSTDEARRCAPADFAATTDKNPFYGDYWAFQKTYTHNSVSIQGKSTCWWWLRSEDDEASEMPEVNNCGKIQYVQARISNAVRPAMWIYLES